LFTLGAKSANNKKSSVDTPPEPMATSNPMKNPLNPIAIGEIFN
jgi:hypothetical protein